MHGSTTNRINWIDWAKCAAITMIVLGHIPQEKGSFLSFYVQIFHVPLFFFISGYLTKLRNTKEELKKCFHSLVIPYILYNIIFYPYWAIRLYIDHGVSFSFLDYLIKPILGLFFLQINTPVSSAVNGAMWFIAALLIMRFLLHFCLHSSRPFLFIGLIMLLSIGIFVITKKNDFPLPLTIEGLLRCTPLYLLGYITKYFNWLGKISFLRDFICAFFLIGVSIVAAYMYRGDYFFTCHIFLFYVLLISAVYGTLFICKVLNGISSPIIINISNGTLMIMGLHWMFIGTTNYIIEHILSMNTGIIYSWASAILFAICIDATIYPMIIWARNHMPILLGK